MTFTKAALGLALALGLSACASETPMPVGKGVGSVPFATRSARVPGQLTDLDMIRVVQSSL